ncbi:hypothetical protein AN963_27515 [Brevibacillus choshinensis]|uniref:Uncharacterized protein n=1 Tax=Brevibacillus choshinensis TaxID=54911 RepID=A0ABR5N4A1_BRECH|nr:hypothetical protein AN963_27515 [Brevibacillus choshinensis]
MGKLIIEPGQGIGTIKLGTSIAEVNECIEEYDAKYKKDYHQTDRFGNYFTHMFMVEYDSNEKVNFIDVFNTKAEQLVAVIDTISKYDRDDRELGWTYHFRDIGLSLWRPNILNEEDLEKEIGENPDMRSYRQG